MTNLICPDLEPVFRLRSTIPESCQAMLDLLLGMVLLPPDQPSCATAIATLAKCMVDYAETIPHTRPFFMEWAGAAQCIHDSVSTHTLWARAPDGAGRKTYSGAFSVIRYPIAL